jgi:hypothetical protein
MTNIGLLHLLLGIYGIFFFGTKYVLDLLQRFSMDDFNPCATPCQSRMNPTKK